MSGHPTEPNTSLFEAVRKAVALRERHRSPGVRDSFDRNHLTISLEDAQHLLRIADAAVEATEYQMFTTSGHPKSHHIVDQKLWEAVTGREWHEEQHAKPGPVVDV